jgi:hypothetical protein
VFLKKYLPLGGAGGDCNIHRILDFSRSSELSKSSFPKVIFPHQHVRAYEFSLVQFLRRQRYLLHGYEARVLHYIPKIIYVIGERILVIAGCQRPSLLEVKPALSEMEQLIPRAFQVN